MISDQNATTSATVPAISSPAVHLRRVEHAFSLLRLQLGHALLIQRNVQGSAIFFTLGATFTQNRDQQKTQGDQKQQPCGKPEINHSWFLSNSWSRR